MEKETDKNATNKSLTGFNNILKCVASDHDKLTILERAISSARNGIVITDPTQPDNPIIYANPSFLQLSGYSSEEVIGYNCRFLQGEDRKQKGLEDLRVAIKKEQPITTVLKNYRKDGSLFWNELTVSPVHNEAGKLINFIGIQNDISSRVEAETRISEFYSMVSHELRTPLTSIRTSLGLLNEGSAGELAPEPIKLVDIAYRNTDRLVRLVNDILDFRKLDAGKIELRYESLVPEDVVTEVVNELKSLASESKVAIKTVFHENPNFKGDRDRINQVLINLTGNAIKFSPPNSEVTIDVLKRKEDFVCFMVKDKGPGISKSEFGKLFKKFQQLDSSDRRKKDGTGLGLVISKSLVELHGGMIGVDSKVGSGSNFWFEIPLKRR